MKQANTAILALLLCLTAGTAAKAQDNGYWPKSSPLLLTYGSQTLEDETLDVKYKSDFAFSLSQRRTYDLHSNAIGGMLKFGIDLNWFDINVARYAKGKGLSLSSLAQNLMGNVTSGTYGTFDDYFDAADRSALAASDKQDIADVLNRIDLGKYQVSATIVGVGPSVRVAPFRALGKSWLDRIRVGVYAHYLPTYTALIFTCEDEDPVVCGGYMSCWRYGGNISFGRIGVGVEHQWGKGKLKKFKAGSKDDGDGIDISSEKVSYLLSGTRFYVGIRF